ncbi:MAG: hypothetical protein WA765_07145 [Candidatus Acidiferrum sp.]
MNDACIVIGNFGTLDWDVVFYEALSGASRLAVHVRDRANVISLAYSLHKVNKALMEFFKKVDEAMEGKVLRDPNAKPVTSEDVKILGYRLYELHRTISRNYEAMARVGLANNSLTGGSMRSLKAYSERILDLADWVEAVQLPDHINKVFDRAKLEKERGELFDLAQVQ